MTLPRHPLPHPSLSSALHGNGPAQPAEALSAGWVPTQRVGYAPPSTLLAWGALWAIVVAAAEGALIQGLADSFWDSVRFWLGGWMVPLWAFVGGLYLWSVQRAERLGRRRALVVGWLLISVSWSALLPLLQLAVDMLACAVPGWADQRNFSVSQIPVVTAFNLWICLFYGGLFSLAYAFLLRGERTRSLLQDAAIARGRTTALRDEQSLAAVRQQVDPALLLAVMGDIEHGYRERPAQADALLGRLVDFLRCALPGLKDRVSTLAAELQLAQAYVQLQAARRRCRCRNDTDPQSPVWQVQCPDELPALPFPSHFMVPLLALAAPGATPHLAVRVQHAAVEIDIHGLGKPLPGGFIDETRRRLQPLLADRFTLRGEPEQDVVAALSLHITTPQPGAHHGP